LTIPDRPEKAKALILGPSAPFWSAVSNPQGRFAFFVPSSRGKEVNPMPQPRPDNPSFAVALKLGEGLYTRARVLAAVRRMSLAGLVREALRQLLESADDLPTLPPTRDAA
jgi:hypothetical protein